MLRFLRTVDTGPARELKVSLRPRMNFVTGDNGLGKSFLLDVAWWALTRSWARGVVVPHRPPSVPVIEFEYDKATPGPYNFKASFDRTAEAWWVPPGRPPIPGLVIYAQVDGGFSVWDPARNYWKKDDRDRAPFFGFTAADVWDGNTFCEGLVRDWASWQREDGEAFEQLKRVLRALSAETELEPGALQRVFVRDPKDYPTIKMAYGQEVPVIHASAGMRRIIALAYLLVWTWREHEQTRALTGSNQAREIVFLVDEIEAHLHPEWQRRIVPALLDVMAALTGEAEVPVQLIAVTHSPLVMASAEPDFDAQQDAIWLLELSDDKKVTLDEFPFSRQGSADNWLTSEVFDLADPVSVAAETAINRAEALIESTDPDPQEIEEVDEALKRALGDIDPYWVEWSAWRKAR